MAKTIITTTEFTDDLDGSKAETTTTFTVDGRSYEIDLSKKNRTAFEKALKPYVAAARTVRATRSRNSTKSPRGSRSDLSEIRAWARSNGFEISDRGRIPASAIEAFDAK